MDYKELWETYKDRKMQNYIKIFYDAMKNPSDEKMNKRAEHERADLLYMEKLDGQNEAQQLMEQLSNTK